MTRTGGTQVIYLTDRWGKPNAFGLGYLAWFFSLKGPTFMVVREKSGE
jgi:hypothetical protein